jgi:hypothetical protein
VNAVRKIVVYELLSLDGVAEAPDVFFTDWDDVMDANLDAVARGTATTTPPSDARSARRSPSPTASADLARAWDGA